MSRCSPWPRQNVAQASEVMADMEQSVATGLLVSSSPGIPPTGRARACPPAKERKSERHPALVSARVRQATTPVLRWAGKGPREGSVMCTMCFGT
ncbi:hypothetical protein NDU88_006792 [Pleurodeles waltl]|uniref:Uncharacterized protein n=1 Tax=Pleurodeles waltl TaxID=8319 RepID=A0AAV7VS07_PLEWA|nr:hypothetical protein NDU88_006792 [Pleurodeles waltl]